MHFTKRNTLQIGLMILLAAGTTLAHAERNLSPDTYEKRMSEALNEVSDQIPSNEMERIEFGVNLFIAHEAWIRNTPQEALIKAIDAFKEAGIDRVDINPGLSPWLDGDQATIAKYDAAVERIKKLGLKLVLNPQYSPIKHKVSSFAEWQERAITLYTELARRYQPDIFVVAHEPSTMASRLGKNVSVSEWVVFVRQAAQAVKAVSPKSRIGAGGLATEQTFFNAFVELPEVEVLTLDIYSLRELKIYNQMILAAQSKGKPAYIEETWRPPYFRPQLGLSADKVSLKNVGNQQFEALDSRWLRSMTSYAQSNRLEAITPVWMFALFKYVDGNGDLNDPAYNRAVIEAIMRGERTTTFRTLQELTRENNRLHP